MIARKTRTYEYAAQTADFAAAARLSGLDYMRELAAGRIGAPPSIGATLGMSLPSRLEYGEVVFEAEAADFLLNPMGNVHGGFAATILDSALGVAVHTTLEPGTVFTTAELKVNFTRPIAPDSGRLRAEGKIVHRGRRMATSEARLTGVEDGKLYAHGSATCFIFPLPKTKE